MNFLANDIRKNAEAIAPAKEASSKPDGCWVRIGLVGRIGLRNNPDGSATFEIPDTYPTAGIVLHPEPNSDQNTLIGGSAENSALLSVPTRTAGTDCKYNPLTPS